ncbi:hypothetical protein PMAYCL1PPCAC_05591, partial [Pristionchus mayeri]
VTREEIRYPEIVGPIPLKNGTMGTDGCIERIPYASLMATLSCVIGVILFAIMMIWGFNSSVEQVRRILQIVDWPWLDRINIFFICIAVIMALLTIFLLIVGIASTGSTRENMFRAKEARMGGRIACAIALTLCVVLLGFWLVLLSFSSLLLALFAVFTSLCNTMPDFKDDNCLDFTTFQPLMNDFAPNANLRLCGGEAQEFCALSNTSFTWFIIGWVGAAIVCVGIAQFLVTHAANYSHVSNANKYVELRDVAYESYAEPIARPYRGGRGETMEQWAPPPPSSYAPSSSRLAQAHSDSVSQYAYKGRNY